MRHGSQNNLGVKIVHKKITPEILFTRTELLADPANPSHAYCSECDKVKSIESFRRRVPPLLLEKWGWDKLIDKRNAKHTFTNCNACAKKKRLRPKGMDYNRYDAELKATGKHEFVVQLPDGEKITERELIIRQTREQRRQGKVRGAHKARTTRYKTQYETLQNKIKTEIAKVKYQRTEMGNLTQEAKDYLNYYIEHLTSIRTSIVNAKADALKPKQTPADYINPEAIPTRQAREQHNKLGGIERERVSSAYL